MKTTTASHQLARTGLALAALALASCAADVPTSQHEISGSTKPAPAMSARSGAQPRPCTGQQSHSLFLEDANGKDFRLVHVLGCGWTHVDDGSSGEDRRALRKMSFSPVSASQAETSAATTNDPMAVFIDGPTGYTFVWTGDTGWKFAGYLSDD